MKTKQLPELSSEEKARLTQFCQDTAEAEATTPAAVAIRVANDPALLKQATSYERPKQEPPAPPATPAPAENRKPKTENQPPKSKD